jgi:hypothetical protein
MEIEVPRPKPNGHDAGAFCLELSVWLDRDIPAPDFLLGEVISTTSRMMLVAPTGLGKTNFAMALGFAVAGGADFLHWAGRGRAARVLFIDGEMSRRLLKRRLADAARRAGCQPVTFFALCRDDVEAMPPLNAPEGSVFIDSIIEKIGGVDLMIFDNVMSLIAGDMREEDGWQQVLPWIRGLTKRSIGQIWVHHTGHDETHSYGTKTREWQLDTVALLERDEQPFADIAFTIKFTKARERSPDNRSDFDHAIVTLAEDRWHSDRRPERTKKLASPKAMTFHRALVRAIEVCGEARPIYAAGRSVTMEQWRAEAMRIGAMRTEAAHKSKGEAALFSKYRLELVAAKVVECNGDFVWLR